MRPGIIRSWNLAALSVVLIPAGWLAADDYAVLLRTARSQGAVPVLVTGWHAITGDARGGSRGGGWVAVTGDEFAGAVQAEAPGAVVTRRYDHFPVLAMRLAPDSLRRAKSYRSSVEVWADPVLLPSLAESTQLVGADAAWRRGYTGAGVAVAVIDDGADTGHPFLGGRILYEGCFADVCPNGESSMVGTGAAAPVGLHGTHVAGIAAGGWASERLNGVGPELSLIVINVANRNSAGMLGSNVLAALDAILALAEDSDLRIGAVNMSLGARRDGRGVCRSPVWDLAAEWFRAAEVPVVVAAGNDATPEQAAPAGFPACVEGFIGVGAVTKEARVAGFSNSGPSLELLAPGVDIRSAVVDDPSASRPRRGFAALRGTSMAAPHVAGALALLLQAAPDSAAEDRIAALKATGRPVTDPRNGITAELIDVGRAIALLQEEAPESLEPQPVDPPARDRNGAEGAWQTIEG